MLSFTRKVNGDRPSAHMGRTIWPVSFISLNVRRRVALLEQRKYRTHRADTSCDRTVAMAAPPIPMSST